MAEREAYRLDGETLLESIIAMIQFTLYFRSVRSQVLCDCHTHTHTHTNARTHFYASLEIDSTKTLSERGQQLESIANAAIPTHLFSTWFFCFVHFSDHVDGHNKRNLWPPKDIIGTWQFIRLTSESEWIWCDNRCRQMVSARFHSFFFFSLRLCLCICIGSSFIYRLFSIATPNRVAFFLWFLLTAASARASARTQTHAHNHNICRANDFVESFSVRNMHLIWSSLHDIDYAAMLINVTVTRFCPEIMRCENV